MSLKTNKSRIVDIEGGDYDNPNTIKDEQEDKLQEQQTKLQKQQTELQEQPTELQKQQTELRGCTIEGNWKEVERLYNLDVNFSTMNINKSIGTALHMAVNEGNESVVRSLVGSILFHRNVVAFEMKNGKGDTPLHLAASRGFQEICECIIGKNYERKDLIDIDNNNKETPFFLASLFCQKETFLYLLPFVSYSEYLFRSNGDSILHCAILGEYFDLALKIIQTFPKLGGITNNEGYTPLKLLATRPSAFESGCKMTWWKKILYHYISVENLNIEEVIKCYNMKQDQENLHLSCPKNYETCGFFLRKCQLGIAKLPIAAHIRHASNNKVKEQKVLQDQQPHINISMSYDNEENKQKVLSDQQQISISMSSDCELLPENYATCLWFLKFAYIYILGLFGVGVHEVRKMKQKHKWCRELLTFLMKKPYDSYYGANTKPLRNVSGTDSKTTYDLNKEDTIKDMCETSKSEDTKKSETLKSEDAKKLETLKIEEEKKAETLKSETPILTAARYGIVEMVNVLIKKIPSSIYEINLENKNILLVAVENRRTVVVKSIRKWSKECAKKEVFDSLIRQVDNEDNTMLHLAATPSGQDWNIHGAALQLMWHIKWFQYVKGLVPKHFTIKTNKKNKTAGETFKDKHNCLVQKGSEWLKTTSESCSVVAGLLAGVSFATSSTIPGGNKGDTGEPALEGKLPFDTFAMSSLIGLCFSVTALIMFLSILVSRKEAIDFRIDLPRKLLWGLSSLFLSIIAMFIAFCSGNFFLIDQKYKQIVLPIYIFTCFPVTLYAILYIELLRGILTKIPMRIDKGEDL